MKITLGKEYSLIAPFLGNYNRQKNKIQHIANNMLDLMTFSCNISAYSVAFLFALEYTHRRII